MIGTAPDTGVTTGDGAGAGADEDERLEELAPPPPLVNVPTEVTEAESAEVRRDPNVTEGAVTVERRFSSHSAI